jgi:hypothetical protein
LKRPIFKKKKGFANLCLGLIYHPKALPQPPSRDTVPLKQEAIALNIILAHSYALVLSDMNFLMFAQIAPVSKRLGANLTLEGPLPAMNALMPRQVTMITEGLGTDITLEGLGPGVRSLVYE